MNLKIEDLEKEMSVKKLSESGLDGSSSRFSLTSNSFVNAGIRQVLASTSQHGSNVDH